METPNHMLKKQFLLISILIIYLDTVNSPVLASQLRWGEGLEAHQWPPWGGWRP